MKLTSADSNGRTITLPNGYRGLIVLDDSSLDRTGVYFVVTSGSGSVGVRTVLASSLTIDYSEVRKIKFTSTGVTVLMIVDIIGTSSV